MPLLPQEEEEKQRKWQAMEAMRQETPNKGCCSVEGFARNREIDGEDYIGEVKSLYVRIRVRCCMRKFCSHSPDYWKNETSVVRRDQISVMKSYNIYLLKCVWFGRGFHTPWSHSHVLAAFFWFARSHHDRRTREQGTWVGKHHPQGPNLALMRIQQNSNSLDLHSALTFLPPGEFSVTPVLKCGEEMPAPMPPPLPPLTAAPPTASVVWLDGKREEQYGCCVFCFCGVSQEWVRMFGEQTVNYIN